MKVIKIAIITLVSTLTISCNTVKGGYRVTLSPATRQLILSQPEFEHVSCTEGRVTVIGADITKGSMVLSINCIEL